MASVPPLVATHPTTFTTNMQTHPSVIDIPEVAAIRQICGEAMATPSLLEPAATRNCFEASVMAGLASLDTHPGAAGTRIGPVLNEEEKIQGQ